MTFVGKIARADIVIDRKLASIYWTVPNFMIALSWAIETALLAL
jgi:hypothetical protein